MSDQEAKTGGDYVNFLQEHVRDLRMVLETLHESDPWVPRDEFRSAFIENDLAQLYLDMFGSESDA